ncbi:MAG: hypothetical protein IPN95_31650 [Bacteroidetes bacterium]|nr:hypothetical protein [Bacteroidota bacterium]
MAEGILSSALGAAKDFIKSWDSDDMYNKWFFRGKIAGMIITEVILAIVTAGSSLGAKLTSKLLDAFPKLGKVAAKILKAADKLNLNKKKKSSSNFGADDGDAADLPKGNDFDNVNPDDKKQMEFLKALGWAKILTDANDLMDTPVPILLKQLETTVGAKFPAVSGYRANPVPGQAGTYQIVQFAKEVKGNYKVGNEEQRQQEKERIKNGDPKPRLNATQHFTSYESARNAALKWLEQHGFKADRPNLAKMKLDPNVGKPIGMVDETGKIGFRIEFGEVDGAMHPHINVFDKSLPKGEQDGPHFVFPGDQNTVNTIIKRFL